MTSVTTMTHDPISALMVSQFPAIPVDSAIANAKLAILTKPSCQWSACAG